MAFAGWMAQMGRAGGQGYQRGAFRERGSTDGLDPVFASLVASCMQYGYLGEVSNPAERDGAKCCCDCHAMCYGYQASTSGRTSTPSSESTR